MDKPFRSRRGELAALRTELSAKGATVRQIASAIAVRLNVNSRVAFRYALGLTQQQVADQWNELWPESAPPLSHKQVSYWEAWPAPSGRAPTPAVLDRLAQLYRCRAADLLDGADYSEDAGGRSLTSGGPTAAGVMVPAEPSDVLGRVDAFLARSGLLVTRESDYNQLVKDLTEWALRMQRRDILQWLSVAAAAAAAAPILDGLEPSEQQRVTEALVAPGRVDASVIDHITAVLWRCMRQDDSLGPQAALDTVLAQRSLARMLLPDAPAGMRTRLLSLYANLSRFAGWLAFDLSNFDAAADYYETARAAAHEAHDTELGAFVLCNMSHLASWRGQARIGVDHALAAQGWAMQTGDGRLQAYAFDVGARALAMDGQQRAALVSLDRAQDALVRSGEQRSELVYFFDAGQLGSTESVCHLYLGNAEEAARLAERAVDGIDASFVRNLALATLRLGIARLRSAKPDVAGGAQAIADTARLAAHNRSARLVQRLHNGVRELESWRDEPEVKAVHEQLASYRLV